MLLLSSKIHSSRNVRLLRFLPPNPLAPLLLIMSLAISTFFCFSVGNEGIINSTASIPLAETDQWSFLFGHGVTAREAREIFAKKIVLPSNVYDASRGNGDFHANVRLQDV